MAKAKKPRLAKGSRKRKVRRSVRKKFNASKRLHVIECLARAMVKFLDTFTIPYKVGKAVDVLGDDLERRIDLLLLAEKVANSPTVLVDGKGVRHRLKTSK